MRINYIRVSASALVLVTNIIGGGTVAITSTSEVVAARPKALLKSNNYKPGNTIYPLIARITLP